MGIKIFRLQFWIHSAYYIGDRGPMILSNPFDLLFWICFSEYGVALTELTLSHDGVLQIRQMAALLLKQYVDTHWSSMSEKFKSPETTPQAKATIRQMLPHGLKESISKVG